MSTNDFRAGLLASAAVYCLCACTPASMIRVPPAGTDAPPSIRIVNFEPQGANTTSYAEVNGFVGQAHAENTVSKYPSGNIVFFTVKATNMVAGVRSLAAEGWQGGQLIFKGSLENAPAPDGTVPTESWLASGPSATGPLFFGAELDTVGVSVVATSDSFNGATTKLTEIYSAYVGPRPQGGPYPVGATGGSNDRPSDAGCTGSPPTSACMAVAPGCGSIPGRYACVSGKYVCKVSANIDYCISGGVQAAGNCGETAGTCSSDADCVPNTKCLARNADGTGGYSCRPTAAQQTCPSATCWLPKNLATYNRNLCYTATP